MPKREDLLGIKVSQNMVSVNNIDVILPHLLPDDYVICHVGTGKKKDEVTLVGGYFICVHEANVVISPKMVHASSKKVWDKLKIKNIHYIYIDKGVETRIIAAVKALAHK